MMWKKIFFIILFILIINRNLLSNEKKSYNNEFQIQINCGLGYFFTDAYMERIREKIKQKIINDGYEVTDEFTTGDNVFLSFLLVDSRYFYKNIGAGLLWGVSYVRGSSIDYKKPADEEAPVYMYLSALWSPRLFYLYYKFPITNKYFLVSGIGGGSYRFVAKGTIQENDEGRTGSYSVKGVQGIKNYYMGLSGLLELYSGGLGANSWVYGLRFYYIKVETEWMPGIELYTGYNFSWGF